jgi:hypothetical protein
MEVCDGTYKNPRDAYDSLGPCLHRINESPLSNGIFEDKTCHSLENVVSVIVVRDRGEVRW